MRRAMSKSGVRIYNIQAASIYEYMNGFRGYMDMTKAMLVNSLFLDYLLDNDLINVQNDSTKSIICLEFGYGTKDYKALYENAAKELGQAKKELTDVTRQKEFLEKQAEELMQMLRAIRSQISSVKGI